MSDRQVHLPGLNALRFYAALSVVIAHTSNNFGELRTRPADIGWLNAMAMDAQSAVSLFFVLSGFLISYLLLREVTEQGRLDVPRFYLRRALRIWPLYYLTVAIGFLLLPALLRSNEIWASTPAHGWILVLLFLPNFVTPLGPLGHLWSIGLEEQFYLAWPWVVARPHAILRVAFGILLVKVMTAPVVASFGSASISNLFLGLRFECMAIGALGAYLAQRRRDLLPYVHAWPVRAAVLIGLAYLAWTNVELNELTILVSSTLFLGLILNVATDPRVGGRLESPWVEQLGRISYGVYMYHFPLLYVALLSLQRAGIPEGPQYTAVLYVITVFGTLALAAASYRWVETPFLRRKEQFAVVPSRA